MKQINLIYYSVFFLWYLLSLLPLRFLYFISDLLFYPLYYCIRYRRKIIRNNLSNSFPEKDLKEIVQIEKQYSRNAQVILHFKKTTDEKNDF
jgi:KDO2-lipid IV(A) lauroyltransferase